MKIKFFLISFISLSLLAACSADNEGNSQEVADSVYVKQMVNDFSTDKITALSASIDSEVLKVLNEKNEGKSYKLPDDEFFVSIAPYIENTHPCATHSLTGCRGEMVNMEFDVLIKDADGNVVIYEKMTTYSNGFIDLWLPRDKKYIVEISKDGKKAASDFSMYKNDNTCITTLKLV